jgi:hypothetical protein
MTSQFWNEERVAILKRCRAEQWTARAIAELLGCTRNAVLGKAGRLELEESIHRGGRPVTTGEYAKSARAEPVRAEPVRVEPARLPVRQPVELPITENEPPSRRIAFANLKTGECRWISGDDGCCCGHATTLIVARGGRVASPYCGFHSARAYRAPRERSALALASHQRGDARLQRAMASGQREKLR